MMTADETTCSMLFSDFGEKITNAYRNSVRMELRNHIEKRRMVLNVLL